MATHNGHPTPDGCDEFLVDGCPRCEEFVRDLGLHFDPERFRAFWEKMARVEWDNSEGYASTLDRDLGRRLYLVSLSFQKAYGLHPHDLGRLVALIDGSTFRDAVFPRPEQRDQDTLPS